jgi:hypothetical protein
MIVGKHIKSSEEVRSLSSARDIGASRVILSVVEYERDKLRNEVEKKPEDELNIVKLSKINVLNWVLDLPGKARELIDKVPEGE